MRKVLRTCTGLLAAAVLMPAAGCAGAEREIVGSASPTATGTTDGQGRFPAVLSTTTADSGRTVTATELAAELAITKGPRPAGFRGLAVVVASGLGSFDVAVPVAYSTVWRAGTPPQELIDGAARRDASWADYAGPILLKARPDGLLRAVALDTAPPDQVIALFVTLTAAPEESGDALAQSMGAEFERAGKAVAEKHAVQVNGAAGAYAEFTIPALTGSSEPRVGMQVRIPDPPNRLLWGLTCEGPESMRAEVEPVCAQIAATFRPLPAVSG